MQAVERTIPGPAVAPSTSAPSATAHASERNLSVMRNIKIGSFHIGSSLADILASGVWNRVMITELGFAATPVGLLLALRYFLAPLSIWVGRMSDLHPVRGYHRLPYVWGGRLAMVLSYVLLGISTLALAGSYDPTLNRLTLGAMHMTVGRDAGNALAWIGVISSLIMFSIGSTFSSTTFLSLIYDRTPKAQRTRAVSLTWFFLILGFAVSGVIYSRILPEYSRDGFLSLFLIAPLIMGSIFFFSLIGEERPVRESDLSANTENPETTGNFWQTMRMVWGNAQTKYFFGFLALSTLFFYTQDAILEPFAGQVFGMPVATTSRFASYWGSMTLLGIIVCLVLARRNPKRFNNTALSRWGVITLALTFILFLICSLAQIRGLVTIGLITMGIGLGMWTVGSLGLMMDLTRAWGAGLYLALWTVASTLARGSGIVVGGVTLDLGLALTGGNRPLGYGLVFLIQTVGFVFTLWLLARVGADKLGQETPRTEDVAVTAMD